jgi:hypothetical protein
MLHREENAMQTVAITIDLSEDRAAALAQFIKRVMLSDCEAKCSPQELKDEEHHRMQAALSSVGKALAEQGFNPR